MKIVWNFRSRPEQDHRRVAAALAGSGNETGAALARLMDERA